MTSKAWTQAINACADPQRARRFLEQLAATPAAPFLQQASPDQARILAALLAGSQALGELLLAHPEWLESTLRADSLQHPRRAQGLQRELQDTLAPLLKTRSHQQALSQVRRFKQREMLRIASRDLARLGDAPILTREISDVADVCLEAVLQIVRDQVGDRLGSPWHQDAAGRWQPTEFCVLGMGKLGGQELNYSSDVDLLFVYSEEGWVFKSPPRKTDAPGRGLASHQFFRRLIEAYVAELTRLADEGALFRVDLRLRPEGDVGPLARSLASYENFYAQWGQTWERMMLIKTRCVAGDAGLAAEFLEMIQPFRYPRSLNQRLLKDVVGMKQRIENEIVKAGAIDRNVKLGRGGIREVEFVAQTLQLLNAGRSPFLQNPQTIPTLQKLVQYHLLPEDDARALGEAYVFLRDVEHRLQMNQNQQTHTIPTDRKERERLAALMGFPSLENFEKKLQSHTRRVRQVYDNLLRSESPAANSPLPPDIEGHETEWKRLLAEHAFRDPDQSLRLLQALVSGPGYIHVSPRTTELALQLLPRLLARCPRRHPDGKLTLPPNALSDPDRVLARLDTFVSAYGTRTMLYELWTSNPSLFELLILLFDRSEFLAEVAIRTPDLVDELELSGRLRRRKSADDILEDLRHGLRDRDQKLWIRRYHEAERMRIGLRDILGLADFEQNLVELSALADACLQYALDVVMRNHKLRSPPFAIIGLGKLGGSELNYGSDLDILFVARPKTRDLPRLQRLAAEILDLLSSQTELGVAFETDARLRPDGEKGLLVNTLDAYETYYRQRAMLWEIQSITRTRPIAGDPATGADFQALAARLTNFNQPAPPLAAFQPTWRAEIARMRLRIEKERTPAGQNDLAIKTGTGGLMDAEFIAQTLCLAHGWHEANTLRALQLARDHQLLPDADAFIEHYRKLRRVEGILRRWSFAGETVLPDDPAPLYRVAVRCGFLSADEFMAAVRQWRAGVRAVYAQVLPPA